MGVLDAVDIDLDLVADGDLGLLARRGELAQRHAAFGFQPDIDHREIVLDRGDRAGDDAALEGLVLAAEGFVEQRGEIVARGVCRSGHELVFLNVFLPAWRLVPPVFYQHAETGPSRGGVFWMALLAEAGKAKGAWRGR